MRSLARPDCSGRPEDEAPCWTILERVRPKLALIEAERDLVNTLYRSGELKDEGRRRIERELDLRDTLLANLRSPE